MNNYELALRLVQSGHVVGPGSPKDKRPLGKWKEADGNITCRTAEQVEAQWARHPDAVPLIFCKMSGIVVVDVDPRNGGQLPKDLPTTLMYSTPSGGWHLYYRQPDDRVTYPGQLSKGVDLKWDGYVVARGAETDRGKYESCNTAEMALAPTELAQKRTQASSLADQMRSGLDVSVDRTVIELLDRTEVLDLGNDDFFKVLGAVYDSYAGTALLDEALDALLAWNEAWAEANGRDVEEAQKAAQQRWDAYAAKVGSHARPARVGTVVALLDPDRTIKSELKGEARAAKGETHKQKIGGSLFKRYVVGELPELRPWLLENVIREGEIGGWIGSSTSGKSTIAATLCLAMGSGDRAAGFPVTGARQVAWVNAEEDSDILQRRLEATRRKLGVELQIQPLIAGSEIMTAETGLLAAKGETGGVTVNEVAVRAWLDEMIEAGVDMIIIDPITDFNEGEENSRTDRLQLLMAMRELAREAEMAVLYMGHTGHEATKGKRGDSYRGDLSAERGSSAAMASNAFGATLTRRYPKSLDDKECKDKHGKEYDRRARSKNDPAPNIICITHVKAKAADGLADELFFRITSNEGLPIALPMTRLEMQTALASFDAMESNTEEQGSMIQSALLDVLAKGYPEVGDYPLKPDTLSDLLHDHLGKAWPRISAPRWDKGAMIPVFGLMSEGSLSRHGRTYALVDQGARKPRLLSVREL